MAKIIDFIAILWLTRIPFRNSGAKVICIYRRKKYEFNIFAKKKLRQVHILCRNAPNSMKSILIITNRTLHTAPRIIRAIRTLENHFQIHTVGLTAPNQSVASHTHSDTIKESISSKVVRKIRREAFGQYAAKNYVQKGKLRRINNLLKGIKPDIVMCHECGDVPYLAKLKDKYGYKLIFNAHEYYPLEFDEKPNWASTWQVYYEDLYNSFLPQVDLMVNVCDSIRDKCLEVHHKDSIVVPNAAFYSDLEPNPIGTKIKLIHHGGSIPSRKIEEMIKLTELLGDGYELTLMLMVVDKAYHAQLIEMAKSYSNVHFVEPVPFKDIIPTLNKFDMGIYILPPTSFNNAIALPNKIFEFVQSKLGIAIGPSPEMSNVVKNHHLGVISTDFTAQSLADEIKKLSKEDIYALKQHAKTASSKISAEHYSKLFLEQILQL